jgi:transposase-like protein
VKRRGWLGALCKKKDVRGWTIAVMLGLAVPNPAHCPHCKSIDLRDVGIRNAFEQAIFWLLQPYRCSLCGKHFFLFRWQVQ